MSLIVRLKRKLFAAWNENLRTVYEHALDNQDKEAEREYRSLLEERFPKQTSGIKDTRRFVKDVKDSFRDIDKAARKKNKRLLKVAKAAKIAGIGGGIAAGAGLAYGLKKAHDNKKAWEEEKKGITDPNKINSLKESKDQKKNRQLGEGAIVTAGTLGGALTGAAIVGRQKARADKLYDRKFDIYGKKMLERHKKFDSYARSSPYGVDRIIDADSKFVNKLSQDWRSKGLALDRLNRKIGKKAPGKVLKAAGLGLAGGAALATMYGINQKVANEKKNSTNK
jgi:hypothetical protein